MASTYYTLQYTDCSPLQVSTSQRRSGEVMLIECSIIGEAGLRRTESPTRAFVQETKWPSVARPATTRMWYLVATGPMVRQDPLSILDHVA